MIQRILSCILALSLLAALASPALADDALPYGLPKLEITGDTVTYLAWESQRNIDTYAANLLMQEVYGCKLKVVRTTYAELSGKAATLRLSGNTPDLVFFRNQEFPAFIANDIVTDVTEYLDFDNPLYADLKTTADMYAYQDRYYLFPISKMYNNNYVYYWTSYFDDLGLETPLEMYENGEWTLDAMREMMKELTLDEDRDGIVDIYGAVINPAYSYLMTGEDLVIWDPATGTYANNLRSPAVAKYFDFLYETSSAGDDSRLMSVEGTSCFASKSAVMMIDEQWVMSTYYDEIMNGDIGVAPAPRMTEDMEYTDVGGRVGCMWVGKDCKNLNGALAYLACCRAVELNEGLAEELALRAGQQVKKWSDDIEAMLDEMNDESLFHMRVPRFWGVGAWGDSADGVYDFFSITAQFENPWPTSLEKHYPLLQDSIDTANDANQR